MATPTFMSIADKVDVGLSDLERYWKRAEQSYERQMEKARKGEREPIEDKHEYIMATTLRQAQRTGPRPHKKLGKKKKKEEKQEHFENRLNAILESI